MELPPACAWFVRGFMHKSKPKREKERGALADNLGSPLPQWESSRLTCCTAGISRSHGHVTVLTSPLLRLLYHDLEGGSSLSSRKPSVEDENTMQEDRANSNLNPFSFPCLFHTMRRQHLSVVTPLSPCGWVWNVPHKKPLYLYFTSRLTWHCQLCQS